MAADKRPTSVASGLQMSCVKSPNLCLGGGHRGGTGEQQTPLKKRPLFCEGKGGKEGAGGGNMCLWAYLPSPERSCVTRELPQGCVGTALAGRGQEEGSSPPRTHPYPLPIPTCLLLHVFPQQVAAGEVLHAEVLDNPSGDGAFAGARRPHDDGAQQRRHHHGAPGAPPLLPLLPRERWGAAGAPPSRAAPPRTAGSPGRSSQGNAAAASPAVNQGQEGKIFYVRARGKGRDKWITIMKITKANCSSERRIRPQ